jgi:hypothetical protein
MRARLLEQRQALIEAALTGQKIDASMIEAAATRGRLAKDGPLARVEQQQLEQAALVARALDVRYQVSTAELKKLGINPPAAGQPAGVGGPFEKIGNPTFKALFNSWKKLDQLQNDVIAIPSDKPINASVTFTSAFGVRDDPFHRGAAMHPGIDLAGAYGTPIYATADGVVLRAGWNSGGYGNLVVGIGGIGEFELVSEARAAPAIHGEPEDGRLRLAVRDPRDALRRILRKADVAHLKKIGSPRARNNQRCAPGPPTPTESIDGAPERFCMART